MSHEPPCDYLTWDSEFWGFGIARVRGDHLTHARLGAIDAWMSRSGVACLFFLASPDAPDTWALAEAAGFRLMDIRIELERRSAALEAAGSIRPATNLDVARLMEIAGMSHGITRFYADPHFPNDRCDEFYATWVRRSALEGFAEQVLVIEHGRETVGYVTCHANAETAEGSIGLIAVSNQARGNGLGVNLTRAAVQWGYLRGLERMTVVTQGRNVPAQRTFQRAGFTTLSTGVWFHRWQEDIL
jgi:dTDP-4-amino-4,6-dideoxy-D-galactose acyltransferase